MQTVSEKKPKKYKSQPGICGAALVRTKGRKLLVPDVASASVSALLGAEDDAALGALADAPRKRGELTQL